MGLIGAGTYVSGRVYIVIVSESHYSNNNGWLVAIERYKNSAGTKEQ